MVDSPRIDELKRRLHADPGSAVFAALAEEYRRVGRVAEAIDTCVAGLARHPGYVSARVTLGRSLLDAGRFDEARHHLEAVIGVAPDNFAALRSLADVLRHLGELRQALRHLRLAAALAPRDSDVHEAIRELNAQVEAAEGPTRQDSRAAAIGPPPATRPAPSGGAAASPAEDPAAPFWPASLRTPSPVEQGMPAAEAVPRSPRPAADVPAVPGAGAAATSSQAALRQVRELERLLAAIGRLREQQAVSSARAS